MVEYNKQSIFSFISFIIFAEFQDRSTRSIPYYHQPLHQTTFSMLCYWANGVTINVSTRVEVIFCILQQTTPHIPFPFFFLCRFNVLYLFLEKNHNSIIQAKSRDFSIFLLACALSVFLVLYYKTVFLIPIMLLL